MYRMLVRGCGIFKPDERRKIIIHTVSVKTYIHRAMLEYLDVRIPALQLSKFVTPTPWPLRIPRASGAEVYTTSHAGLSQ